MSAKLYFFVRVSTMRLLQYYNIGLYTNKGLVLSYYMKLIHIVHRLNLWRIYGMIIWCTDYLQNHLNLPRLLRLNKYQNMI